MSEPTVPRPSASERRPRGLPRTARVPLWAVAAGVGTGLALASCGFGSREVPREKAGAVALSTLAFAELEIPPNNLPNGEAPSETIPLTSPFRKDGVARKGGKFKYVTDVPFRPRSMFFAKPQGGAKLHTADGTFVPYDKSGQSPDRAWSHDRHHLILYEPTEVPVPESGQYVLTHPKAAERERALNLAFSEHAANPKAFVWTEITDGWDTRTGLLLPAPGTAAWDLELPPAAELHFAKGLVEPEILIGEPSDGAQLVVEVEADGQTHEVFREGVAIRSFEDRRVDLSRWSGRQVRLRMRSEPGATATYDYVFAGAPVVSSRVSNPVRVVMIFLDTVRPDHLTLYGYDRDTSVNLDPWAAKAAVFTEARSVAPWTLPSARTIVTGRQPEDYFAASTLPELLHDRGWASGMIAGNVYLMASFGMNRGWDLHRIDTWPPANEVADAALAWMEAHDGRDALLQVQFMSAHLPYIEPEPYLHLYAGDMVRPLQKGFMVEDIRKGNVSSRPEIRQYVLDRYDNNIRFLTDSVRRIVDELDDNDYVLIYADHGEELWDHDGFEHGHTLFDELLRVPLIIDGPGIDGARINAPVSLLDIAPTVLDLLGEPIPTDMVGRSLVPLLRGDPGAAAEFAARDQAFGRPLYGFERWGVLHNDQKWTVFEGRATLFDLEDDPSEKVNILRKNPESGAPFPQYLGGAVGRPVVDAFRFVATPARPNAPDAGFVWMLCSMPGGFAQSFLGNDAMENSRVSIAPVPNAGEAQQLLRGFGITDHPVPADAEAVQICWEAGWSGTREAYLVPNKPLSEAGPLMVCSAYHGTSAGEHATLRLEPDRAPDAYGPPLARAKLGARAVNWTVGTVPVPPEHAIVARDAESTEMLIQLGYLTPEQAEQAERAASGLMPTSGCKR